MKYYELFDDVHIQGRWHLGEATERDSGMSLELWHGLPATDGISIQTEITHVGKALEFCLTSFAVPVAQRRLAHALAAVAGRDIQMLPVHIPGCEGFYILN